MSTLLILCFVLSISTHVHTCARMHVHISQGCSHQVWGGQVCSQCVCKHATGSGVWGHAPPGKFVLEFRGYEIASENVLGVIRCFSKARWQSFTCMSSYLPFLPIVSYSTGSLGRTRSFWKKDSEEFFHISHLASFNMSPVCLGALRGRLPSKGIIGNAKAQVWKKVVQMKPD